MFYYYTPVYVEPEESLTAGDTNPGKDEGAGVVSAFGDLPGGLLALKRDDTVPRFVLRHNSVSSGALPGWTVKTASEINTDYPGLIP